jgi:hypothetical protein
MKVVIAGSEFIQAQDEEDLSIFSWGIGPRWYIAGNSKGIRWDRIALARIIKRPKP